MIKTLQTYVVMLLAILGFSINASAAAVELPGDGTAVDWNNATLKDAKVENEGANIGSTRGSTVVTFTLNNATAQGYIMTFYTGAKDAATVDVDIVAGSETCLDETITVSATGSWSCTEKHQLIIANLPAGESTLTFKVTNATGSYAGNWGNLTFETFGDYDVCPGTLSLAKGVYENTIRTENDNDNVGWVVNGSMASYTFVNTVEGAYNLVLPLYTLCNNGSMNIEVTNAEGVVEGKATYAWESGNGNYTETTIPLKGFLTKGVKTIKFTFANESSWVCNYKAPSLVKYADKVALISDISIDGLTVTDGKESGTDWFANIPKANGDNVTLKVASFAANVTATAKDGNGADVAVTDNGDGTFTLPAPAYNTTSIVTFKITAQEGAGIDQDTWTIALFRIGDIEITALAIDGQDVTLPEEINNDPYTATITGRVATQLPKVVATLIDGSTVEGTGVLDGTVATYTLNAKIGEDTRTYIIKVEGINIYEKVSADKSVELKYTNAGKIENNWTNGVYTLETTGLDGWDFNGGFKWNSAVNTWRVPENIVVKQIIFREFGANYNDGVLESVVSEGATTILPTNNAYIKGAKATMVVNLVDHKAGTPIVFTLTGGGQPYGWCELTVEEVSLEPKPEPKKKILYLGGTNKDANNNATMDIVVKDRLAKNYDVTIFGLSNNTDIVDSVLNAESKYYGKNYDAIFLSEAINTSGMALGLLHADVPTIVAKQLVARPKYLGLTDANGKKHDVKSVEEAVVTINPDNATHQLAAGLTGDVQMILEGTTSAQGVYITGLETPADIIPIATVKGQPTWHAVFGVEPGTTLYNTTDAETSTMPLEKTTQRVACIGMHISTMNTMSADAYKLLDAAVAWAMGIETPVVEGTADYTITYHKEAYTTDDATYTVFTTQAYGKDASVKLPAGAPTAPEGMMLSHWAQKDGTKLAEGDAVTADLNVYPVWIGKMLTLSANAKTNVTNDDITARDKCVAKGDQLIDCSYDGAYIEFSVFVKDAGYYTFTSKIATALDGIGCTLGYVDAEKNYVVSDKLDISNNGGWTGGNDYKWLFDLKSDTTYTFRMTCHTPNGYCLNAFTIVAEAYEAATDLRNEKVNGMRYFAGEDGKFVINVTEKTKPVVEFVTSSTLADIKIKAVCDGTEIAIAEDGTIDLSAIEKGKTIDITATVTDGPIAVDHSAQLITTDCLVRELRGTTEAEGSWNNIYNNDLLQEWTDNVFTLTPTETSARLSNGYWIPAGSSTIYGFCTQNAEFTLKAPDSYEITAISFIGHTLYGKETRFTVTGEGVTATPESAALSKDATAAYMECATLALTGHKAGTPLTVKVSDNFANMYIRLEYRKLADSTKPEIVSQNIAEGATIDYTSGCVSLKFSEIVNLTAEASATFDGKAVTPKVEDNVCVNYHFIGVNYSSDHTYVIKAGSIADEAGNVYDKDITVNFKVGPRPVVTKKTFDFVVGVDGTIDEAIKAANASNNGQRYHIFVPNGEYKLSGTSGDHMTDVSRKNLSITGQDMEKAIIYNESENYGISNTATLHLNHTENIYMQEITLRNKRSEPGNGQNVALYDRGNKTVLNKVKLFGFQDTYVTGQRTYHKECHIYGGTDYICGGGSMYFDECTMFNRTTGNVVTAPNTDKNNKWGYVFMNCTVMGKDFTLGRPWQNEPRCYYLNTKMENEPTGTGWRGMGTLVTHFYEYNSMDLNGKKHDLSKRGNSPTSTNTYTPVLTDEQAAEFNVYNVLSSTDGWAPELLAEQVAKPNVTVDGNKASWTFNDITLCMVVFKNGVYVTNTIESSFTMTEAGVYTFRAANEMGGLGEAYEVRYEPVADGIDGVTADETDNSPVYNVKGQRVPEMKQGNLYIRNGQKVIK